MRLAYAIHRDPGTERLLDHCRAFAEGSAEPGAQARLEERVGKELARLLLFALSGDHRRRRACLRRAGKPSTRT